MSKYDFSKLQNGSDIRGVALPGVPGENVNLDAEACGRLAKGFLYWLSAFTQKEPRDLTVAIGMDPRLSGPDLAKAFAEALAPYGTKVCACGLASTPAMFMSTVFDDVRADGAVMITASHLPFNRNGLKFFSARGGLNKGDITDIIVFAESDHILDSLRPAEASPVEKLDLMALYCKHLRDLIIQGAGNGPKPLEGLKIAVDAGNGAGGFYAADILAPLGADVSASRFLDPDGSFPNHAPNPENSKAMDSIREAVLTGKCHLGLIFDTDVDRASAVDETGREINRNGIVAMAAALIADAHPGTTVVTDSITSNQLTDYLENDLGLHHLRFKRGYRNVINKAVELNEQGIDSQLAIETSGHGAYKDNYFLDDGAFLAARIVIRAALLHKENKCISSVISGLSEPAEAVEVRLPITAADAGACGDQALAALADWTRSYDQNGLKMTIVEPNYEGVRVSLSGSVNGWFLLRKSLHDPLMPLNIETESAGGCDAIRKVLVQCLGEIAGLDISEL